jgi:hypothetical protein
VGLNVLGSQLACSERTIVSLREWTTIWVHCWEVQPCYPVPGGEVGTQCSPQAWVTGVACLLWVRICFNNSLRTKNRWRDWNVLR